MMVMVMVMVMVVVMMMMLTNDDDDDDDDDYDGVEVFSRLHYLYVACGNPKKVIVTLPYTDATAHMLTGRSFDLGIQKNLNESQSVTLSCSYYEMCIYVLFKDNDHAINSS